MASLDSDKVRQELRSKLGCKEETGKDHYWYNLEDANGKLISRTKVSLGPKHTIGDTLISKMTRQIGLGTMSNFAGMVSCTKTKEQCLAVINAQCSKPQP
jgi:hypothetical protein